MTRILGLRDPAFLSSIATTGELPPTPYYYASGRYNGAPTVEGVDLTATVGAAGQTNLCVAVYEADTGDPRWLSQITLPTARGNLNDVRVTPTENGTLVVTARMLTESASANPISINIYNGDTVLAPGAFAGTLHANFQTELPNNTQLYHGILVVSYDIDTGAVQGWSALIDDGTTFNVPTSTVAQMYPRQPYLDGAGNVVITLSQQINYNQGFWLGSIYANGVEVENPLFTQPRVGADPQGNSKRHVATMHVDSDGVYIAGSLDWSYPKTNDSGSLFHEGWHQPRKVGNGTKYTTGMYSTQWTATAQIVVNARDGTPQFSGTAAKYRAATFARFDISTGDMDWINGIGSSVLIRDHRAGPHVVLDDGSVLGMCWEVMAGGTGNNYFITQQGGADVVFSKNDGDVVLVRWDTNGDYVYHKRVTVTNNGAAGGVGEGRGLLVDEANNRIYVITRLRNNGGTTFTYGNGETNQYAITDAPGNPNETWVVTMHELSTGNFLWMTELRERSGFSGSDAAIGRMILSADGTELYAHGVYVTGFDVNSGAVFGHNAGVGRHAPGTPIVLTDNLSRRRVGRFVMDAATLEPLRFDEYPPFSGSVVSTGLVFWEANGADSD